MPVTDPAGAKRWAVPARPWILLLVDDEPDILEAVAALVEQELPNVKVLRAKSGREGLDILQSERVDGIISDFRMGGMDGLEFLRIARQCHPTIPRVMLTAYPDPELRKLAKHEAKVQSFLSKLTSPEELLDRVCTLLTYQPAIPATA
jgi:response regulator RpfG family c-di-GMP phosphodiesterase